MTYLIAILEHHSGVLDEICPLCPRTFILGVLLLFNGNVMMSIYECTNNSYKRQIDIQQIDCAVDPIYAAPSLTRFFMNAIRALYALEA